MKNQDVVGRLDHLERETFALRTRSRRVTVGLCVLLVGGCLAMTAKRPQAVKEVRAQRFILEDENGVEIGTWTIEEGTPRFRMRMKETKAQLLLTVSESGAEAQLVSSKLKRLVLRADVEQVGILGWKPQPTSPISDSVIESRLDGYFEGFDHGNVYKLTNGQIWEQTSFDISVAISLNPDVLIYKSKDGRWKMRVEDRDRTITVERLK